MTGVAKGFPPHKKVLRTLARSTLNLMTPGFLVGHLKNGLSVGGREARNGCLALVEGKACRDLAAATDIFRCCTSIVSQRKTATRSIYTTTSTGYTAAAIASVVRVAMGNECKCQHTERSDAWARAHVHLLRQSPQNNAGALLSSARTTTSIGESAFDFDKS